jgi:cytidylate kinase
MGTVVFPRAEAKFFLTADLNIRAKRRFTELHANSHIGPCLSEVEKDMAARDQNDSTRQAAPLQAAPDAIHIDSTHLTPEAVVDLMMAHITQLI